MSYEEPKVQPHRELKSHTWVEAWIAATTRPFVKTFDSLATDPSGSMGRGYLWVAVAGFISFAITVAQPASTESGGFNILFGLMCALPAGAVGAVIGLTIFMGISHIIAKVLGGVGTFEQLIYASAAYYAPILIITAILSPIPYLYCLTVPIGIYSLVLSVIAINGVHQIGWPKAVFSSFIWYVLIVCIIAILIIAILTLLGPQIGGVFSQIVRELEAA